MLNVRRLTDLATDLRLATLECFFASGEAHLGGSFSQIELLVYLHYHLMKKEDIFILSKGHASVPYCLILKSLGYDPKISTHLERDPENGIICTTGSLGHGLPIGAGIAWARKLAGKAGDVYVLISDGECQEGTTWETALVASARRLDNLKVLIDYNKIQALDFVDNVCPLGSLTKKFESFGLHATEVLDGHDYQQIDKGFESSVNCGSVSATIFHTTKGKGVKEFENDPVWHAKKLRIDEYKLAVNALREL
jgi:transketolase